MDAIYTPLLPEGCEQPQEERLSFRELSTTGVGVRAARAFAPGTDGAIVLSSLLIGTADVPRVEQEFDVKIRDLDSSDEKANYVFVISDETHVAVVTCAKWDGSNSKWHLTIHKK